MIKTLELREAIEEDVDWVDDLVFACLAVALEEWESEGYDNQQYPNTKEILESAYDIIDYNIQPIRRYESEGKYDCSFEIKDKLKYQWYELGVDVIRACPLDVGELMKAVETSYRKERNAE